MRERERESAGIISVGDIVDDVFYVSAATWESPSLTCRIRTRMAEGGVRAHNKNEKLVLENELPFKSRQIGDLIAIQSLYLIMVRIKFDFFWINDDGLQDCTLKCVRKHSVD